MGSAGSPPAYAGNMAREFALAYPPRVHPRVCGEYTMLRQSFPTNTGSPPRMRGIFEHGMGGAALAGFTPAYAGNILSEQQVYRR